MDRPFIYIASLMRTGSTLIQESLTKMPHSFIFHEPELCRNKFNMKNRFINELNNKIGMDIHKLLIPPSVDKFKSDVVPLLLPHVNQLGVKEIENVGWGNYVRCFPNIRIIIVGRDPRSLYISIYNWFKRKNTDRWKDGRVLTPSVLIDGLSKDIDIQMEMFKKYGALKVRYEDFCTDTENVFNRIKDFTELEFDGVGDVGGFLSNNPKRINEFNEHGTVITTNKVDRWKNTEDPRLLADAYRFYEIMSKYRDFWGY